MSSSAPTHAVEVSGLSHHYGDRRALDDVGFVVGAGSLFALLGPNGGGKTTLFRVLTTLIPTTSGQVRVFGHDVTAAPSDARRSMGVVFQSPALDVQLTVRENLVAHGHLYGLSGASLDARIDDTLALVNVTDRASDRVGTLSGGLQRRVEIAKALLPEPRLLVLDEPSTGLDPGARRELWEHLAGLRDRLGTTILMTTHLMDEAARCDRVALLHEGQLVANGAPGDLVSEIGGDVLLVTVNHDAAGLARDIQERFEQPVEVVDGRLRIERAAGHRFLAELVEAYPERIGEVAFGKPTLEDVFLHHTGQRWN